MRITIDEGGVNEGLAVVLGLSMAAAIGLLAHLLVFRPLRNAPALGKVIGSVGLMLYLQAVALLNFGSGRAPRRLRAEGADQELPRPRRDDAPLNLYLAGAAVAMGAAVWALLRFSRFGLATRAADENEKGASLLGYSPQRLAGLNWVLSATLAGIVGLCSSSAAVPLDTTGYTELVIPALGAALLGGLAVDPWPRSAELALGMFQAGMSRTHRSRVVAVVVPSGGRSRPIPLVVIVAYLFFRGDRLPIRGTVVQRGLPGAGAAPRARRRGDPGRTAPIRATATKARNTVSTANARTSPRATPSEAARIGA